MMGGELAESLLGQGERREWVRVYLDKEREGSGCLPICRPKLAESPSAHYDWMRQWDPPQLLHASQPAMGASINHALRASTIVETAAVFLTQTDS